MTSENTENWYAVEHVVVLDTDTSQPCEHCSEYIKHDDLQAGINHYLEKHGYRVLSIGPQTMHADDGSPWHIVSAVLGK